MNSYYKYQPNVYLAKCGEQHEKGEIIEVSTRYGETHECIVYNLIAEKDGYYYYSVERADGMNSQERAKAKAERRRSWAESAQSKSEEYYNRSNKDADFLSLGEPIKVGHHSEARHRKMISDSWNNLGKSVEMTKKADEHERKAEYWDKKAQEINLSMPESIEYFEQKLEAAKEYHEGLKSGKYRRLHAYSLAYAKKNVNELQRKYDLALKLWGD